jgi:fluoride exporter
LSYLLIAIGSALGGMSRYACSIWIASRTDSALPWGTILVNVSGSFLIGAIAGALEPASRFSFSPETRENINLFLMIGVLGGYTTFSSFSLQTLVLMRQQQWALAGANIALSVAACLLAVWLGFLLAAVVSR